MRFLELDAEDYAYLSEVEGRESDPAVIRKVNIIRSFAAEKTAQEISHDLRISTSYIYQILKECGTLTLQEVLYKKKGRPTKNVDC